MPSETLHPGPAIDRRVPRVIDEEHRVTGVQRFGPPSARRSREELRTADFLRALDRAADAERHHLARR